MCDNIFKRMWVSAGSYISQPTLAKGAPSYLVSGANALGINMSDLVTVITMLYTVVLLIGAIPGVWRTWDFFRSRRKDHHDETES